MKNMDPWIHGSMDLLLELLLELMLMMLLVLLLLRLLLLLYDIVLRPLRGDRRIPQGRLDDAMRLTH